MDSDFEVIEKFVLKYFSQKSILENYLSMCFKKGKKFYITESQKIGFEYLMQSPQVLNSKLEKFKIDTITALKE